MTRLMIACLAMAFAWHAHAADRIATPQTLPTVLQTAKGGDSVVIRGVGADVLIKGARPASRVTIRAASGASLRSLTIRQSANLAFEGVSIAYTPDAATQAFTPAVSVENSQDITLSRLTIRGGLAVAGDAPDATVRGRFDAVIGQPTGLGVNVFRSQRVTVTRSDISVVDRGVGVAGSEDVTVSFNRIHDLRRTSVAGGGVQNLTIQGNRLGPSRPWNWGNTPLGDHADFIAIATNPGLDPRPSKGVRVLDNLMDQGDGVAILGMWLQGQYGALTFVAPEIARNTILLGNSQGITCKACDRPWVHDNTLLQAGGGPKDAPQIMWFAGTVSGLAERNTAAAISDLSGAKPPLANAAVGTVKPPAGIAPASRLSAARAAAPQ